MPFFMIILGIPVALFWCYELIDLMTMEDEHFPGKSDKLIWAIGFALVPILAPFAFWYWRKKRAKAT